jgi:hypothetical protein
LFEALPYAASATAARRFDRVAREWVAWREGHVDGAAEEFIGEMRHSMLWPAVVHFVGARLAEPDHVRLEHELRYGERITKPSPAPRHHQFLEKVLESYDLRGVVTTNYDLLAERTLRHRVMSGPPRPGFYYPGATAQRLQGASTFSTRHKWVEVTGSVPLCKLHGSLNWIEEGDGFGAFADCRPAYRSERPSFIVAPEPEKTAPSRLIPIWEVAASLLGEAPIWIVVGYSAPVYDIAIAELLSTTGTGRPLTIHVVDPNDAVAARFGELTGAGVVWHRNLDAFLGEAR